MYIWVHTIHIHKPFDFEGLMDPSWLLQIKALSIEAVCQANKPGVEKALTDTSPEQPEQKEVY